MRTIIVALFAVAILFFAAGATAQTPAVQTDLEWVRGTTGGSV